MISGIAKLVVPVDDQERPLSPGRPVWAASPSPLQRMHFGWWSLFEDPDGTRYALGQWS
jgi:hypothetical protein